MFENRQRRSEKAHKIILYTGLGVLFGASMFLANIPAANSQNILPTGTFPEQPSGMQIPKADLPLINCPDPNYPTLITLRCDRDAGAPANIHPYIETCNPDGTSGKPLWVRIYGTNGDTYHTLINSRSDRKGWDLSKFRSMNRMTLEQLQFLTTENCVDPNPNMEWGTVNGQSSSRDVTFNPGISQNGFPWPPEVRDQPCEGSYNGQFNSGCGIGPTPTSTSTSNPETPVATPGVNSKHLFLPHVQSQQLSTETPEFTATWTPTTDGSPTRFPTVTSTPVPTFTATAFPSPSATPFAEGLTFYVDPIGNAKIAEAPPLYVEGEALRLGLYPVECTPYALNDPGDPVSFGCYFGEYRVDLDVPTIVQNAAVHQLKTDIFISESGALVCTWVPEYPNGISGEFQPPYYHARFSVVQDSSNPNITVPTGGQNSMFCPTDSAYPSNPERSRGEIISSIMQQNPKLPRGKGGNR